MGSDRREHASGSRIAGRRLFAAVLDLPVVAGWVVFAGIVGLVARQLGIAPASAVGWDAFAFACLVLPVTVTFALLESGPRRATPGKRRLGMVVGDRVGSPIRLSRSLVRSATKFAPWQLAHTAVFQLAWGATDPGWVALSVMAQVLVVVSVLVMAFDRRHRALHDLVAGTRVVPAGR